MKWPRTLFGRNLLLLIVLLILSQVAWLFIFRLMVQSPRIERLASYVLEQNDLLQFSLSQLPAGERGQMLETLVATHPERFIADARAPASFRQPNSRRVAILMAPLERALGPDYAVRWEHGSGRRLWIRTRLNEQDYWLGFSSSGLVPEAGSVLLAGSLLTGFLALIGTAFIQRHLHRPLRQLESAASAVAHGQTMPALPLDGPREIATVASSFTHMAESLARAEAERTLMLAGVSHDLRTPLAKLRLCVEILRPDADAELIESMTRSIDNADAVIGQFVDFARVGSDESLQLCDPTELLRSVALAHRGTTAPTLLVDAAPPVYVRPVALRRALTNLLENAQRYAPGDISMQLATITKGKEELLRFSVLDRGLGIAAEQIALVRKPFVRLNASRGQQPGAGLGLSIVERIARLHGGYLDLQPRQGGGLTASIVLPLTAIRADRDAAGNLDAT